MSSSVVHPSVTGDIAERERIHCDSKNDVDVAYHNFHAHKPIWVIFGRDVVDGVCY